MGKFRQFLTELPATHLYSLLDDNFSKYQWIFMKLGMCIDVMRICFGLLIGKFCQLLTELSAPNTSIFLFPDDNLNVNGLSQNLVCALRLCKSALGSLIGKLRLFLAELSAHDSP